MQEVVGHVHLGHEAPTAKQVSHGVQTLRLEVLVPKVTVERAKVEATSNLRRILRDGKEGAPQTTLGVVWELLHGRRL